jgi:TATA-box binding protein (TBP) (component of TFIID and TFIIIB)
MDSFKETSYFDIDNNFEDYEELDLKVLNFIQMVNNKDSHKIPDPKYFSISTQSAMCNIHGVEMLDLSLIVVYIAKNIINNIILKKNVNYMIKGIVVDNLILRFDDIFLKKYKNPIIKYMGNNIDKNSIEEVLLMLSNIEVLANNSLKKHGRQKKTNDLKDNEVFYNSCSLYVKSGIDKKCVCIKLFNNGKITLTGAKEELDGFDACNILLHDIKNEKKIFINLDDISHLKIIDYKITMINTDFDTNFKIDLLKLLNILNMHEKELFTKFNPEKYRGLIIGYYWNSIKLEQDGKCKCKSKCNGKGNGYGDGQCKKITISIFKSGSVIITGGRLIQQVEDAYKSINNIFKKYYHEIIKLSILDFIENENENENKINEEFDDEIIEEIKPKHRSLKIKIKK